MVGRALILYTSVIARRGWLVFGVLAGCVSQEQIPLPEPPSPGLHRLIVAGWDEGPAFAQILPDRQEVYESLQPLSLHAFDVSFDPAAAGLCEQRVALSGTDGPPLPIETAQRLNDTPQGELTWSAVTVDPALGPTFDKPGFEFCTLIPGCIEDGECRGPCTPSEVQAPEAPQDGCPPGWRDLGDSEMKFCFPELWIVNNEATDIAPQECPGTQHDLDGTCVALRPCATDEFAEPPDDAGQVAYVSSSAEPGGDGSPQRPFTSLVDALVATDDVVMLAAGSYALNDGFAIGARRLVGVCADRVSLDANLLTVTEEASLTGIRVVGQPTAIQVHGGRLALTGVVVESFGRAVEVSGHGTLTSTQSRLRRLVSTNSPDLPALFVSSATVSLHSTSIEGILSARDASVSLSHFSVVSTDDFNSTLRADRSTINLTRGRLMNRGTQLALYLADTKRVMAKDLFASSLANATIYLDGTDGDHHFDRLAIASRDSTQAAFQVVQTRVQLSDYAVFGGGSALEVRGREDEPVGVARATVRRAWINIGGRVGFWSTSTGGGVDLEDLWFQGQPQTNVATDEFVSCLLQRSTQGSLRRARMRPGGRHGVVVGDRGLLNVEDVEILGQHGRSLWIIPGSKMTVRRLAATESAGLEGSKFGLPGRRSEMSDIDLQVSATSLAVLGGAYFVQGQPEVDLQRFRVRGPLSVDPALQAGGMGLTDGTLEAPTTDWPQSFIDGLSQVRLLTREPTASTGCGP